LYSIAGFERNWWSDCHECPVESFLVWYTTEDSFIIGVAYGKKWGLRSLEALEFEKWGKGLEPSSLTEVTPMVLA